jgi:orotate phosphoribosyltransferase
MNEADPGPFDRSLLAAYERYRLLKTRMAGIEHPIYSRLYLKSRHLKRNLEGAKFRFVTVDQASIWTMEWIKTFPARYDLIVGVPRSGMLIASIIALKLGKGLTTPELLRQGEYWHSSFNRGNLPIGDVRSALLVDDSMDTGRAMSRAMDVIRPVSRDFSVTKGALIVRQEARSMVDLHHKVVAPPRVFEWNILHRKIASYWGHGRLAVDMDGVLCADCPPGVDDDEELYVNWLRNARPYLIPAFEIDAIVTSRLEKYRAQTERWLAEHNVRYRTLYMWDVPTKSERQGRFARHKIDVLLRMKPDMYWESTWAQSQKIWQETKIPTLCIDEMALLS